MIPRGGGAKLKSRRKKHANEEAYCASVLAQLDKELRDPLEPVDGDTGVGEDEQTDEEDLYGNGLDVRKGKEVEIEEDRGEEDQEIKDRAGDDMDELGRDESEGNVLFHS
jgi:hypothetical protein